MSWALAITGKGGVGKTTIAALAVRWLAENGLGPTLAVDADPNSCLDSLLGVRAGSTVGGVREEAKQLSQLPSAGGMGKQDLLDLKIQETLVESERFDLIAMGRPEGPGCYCYANNVLRCVLDRLSKSYPSVVIDNEAGLENLSRRTVQEATCLLFVTDPSARGLRTARRLYDLALEMQVKAERMGVAINRARSPECVDRARDLFADTPVEVLAALPEDDDLAESDVLGRTIFELPAHSAVLQSANDLMERMVRSVPEAVCRVDEP
jgi:CO dehydrogenase maturation factor